MAEDSIQIVLGDRNLRQQRKYQPVQLMLLLLFFKIMLCQMHIENNQIQFPSPESKVVKTPCKII